MTVLCAESGCVCRVSGGRPTHTTVQRPCATTIGRSISPFEGLRPRDHAVGRLVARWCGGASRRSYGRTGSARPCVRKADRSAHARAPSVEVGPIGFEICGCGPTRVVCHDSAVHPSHYLPSAPSEPSASPAPRRTPRVPPRSRSRNASATLASSPPRFTSRCATTDPGSSSGSGDQPGTSTFGGIGGPFTFVWSPDERSSSYA